MLSMLTQLKSCTKCGGDLVFYEGDWRCWQCGQYYYTGLGTSVGAPEPGDSQSARVWLEQRSTPDPWRRSEVVEEAPVKRRRKPHGPRTSTNINSVIQAQKASDEKWWLVNQQIIEYLDQGMSVREIAKLAGRGERRIRIVRDRLADLRAQSAQTG